MALPTRAKSDYLRPKSVGTRGVDNPAAKLLNEMEDFLGGREALITALNYGDEQSTYSQVVGALVDPRNERLKLGTICARFNISIPEFLKIYRKGLMTKAMVTAIQHIAAKTPEIVVDVLNRAVPYRAECPECHGQGDLIKIVGEETHTLSCPVCRGEKTILIQPELATQKFVLETLAGFAPKTPLLQQTLIDNSRSLTLDTSGEARVRLLTSVDKLLRAAAPGPVPLASASDDDYTPERPVGGPVTELTPLIPLIQLGIGSGIFILLLRLAWQFGRYTKGQDAIESRLDRQANTLEDIKVSVTQMKMVCKLQNHWPKSVNGD